MQSVQSFRPADLFLAKEVETIFDEMNLRGDRGIVDVRKWIREGLIRPAGILGRPSKTAAHLFSPVGIFTAAVLLSLRDLGIDERAVLGEVVATFERDLGGETQIERIWHAVTGPLREGWLLRVDVVRPEPGERLIAVHVYTADTPNAFVPEIPIGRYSGSITLDLSHVAENVEAGIAKVLAAASVERED